MLPDGRRLGAHLPQPDGLARVAERAHEIGASAIQVFGDNPTAWRRRAEPSAELERFRARVAEHDLAPIAVHAAYLVNLAGPDETFHARSVEILRHDLEAAAGYGARFVNVHTGSHRGIGRSAGIERLGDGIRAVLDGADVAPGSPMLVLENSAGGGANLGATIEDLADIAEAVDARGLGRDRVGFCVDTAHAWAAGYRLSEPDEVDAFVSAFEERIGLDRLAMIHLNDSKSELGSRLDRHQHVGAGSIGQRGMARVLTHPALRHVATYIETPGMEDGYDAINIRRALDLAAGRPLEPLPPGALTLRGSRSKAAAVPEPV